MQRATLKPPLAGRIHINLKAKLINRASLLPRRLQNRTVPCGKIAKALARVSSTSYNFKDKDRTNFIIASASQPIKQWYQDQDKSFYFARRKRQNE
jgi:hypothetical protein